MIKSDIPSLIIGKQMGRSPCCDKKGLKKGPWDAEEDELLVNYIAKHGHGSWRSLPKLAGLDRCGKSCRLRWTNYLRPGIKRGPFTEEDEKLVIQLHGILGNRWAAIAAQMPGRTDNEIKNLWNTHLKKRLVSMGFDPKTHEPASTICGISAQPPASPSTRHMAQWESARLEAEARLSKESLLSYPSLSTTFNSDFCHDYFLKMWHSEVGQSFRKFNNTSETDHREEKITMIKTESLASQEAYESPASQEASNSSTTMDTSYYPSSSQVAAGNDQNEEEMECNTSCCPSSQIATGNDRNEEEVECNTSKSCAAHDLNVNAAAGSVSSSSHHDLEDSSESALQLLLDFPCNENSSMSLLGDYPYVFSSMFSLNKAPYP